MTLSLLIAASFGWQSCRLPQFEWLLMDSGGGASMSYAMTDMGDFMYVGGHSQANLSIVGAGGTEHHYADADGHKDLYVAKIDTTTGEPVDVFFVDGDASGSQNVLMDLAPMPDAAHLAVVGYFKGNITFNAYTSGPRIELSNEQRYRNAFVGKMSAADGHTEWAKLVSSDRDTNAYGVAADGAGNVVMAGKFCVDTGADPDEYGITASRCVGIVRKHAAADGALEWSKTWNATGSFWGVKAAADGSVYVGGSLQGKDVALGGTAGRVQCAGGRRSIFSCGCLHGRGTSYRVLCGAWKWPC